MSIVTVKVSPTGYRIAADSATLWGQTVKSDDTAKLIYTNDMHVGCSGYADEIGLFQVYCATHKPEGARRSDVLAFLAEFGKWKKARVDNGTINLHYILGLPSCVYYGAGLDAILITNFAAVGSGMNYALAAMSLGKSAKRAVKVAVELNAFCGPPVVSFKRKFR